VAALCCRLRPGAHISVTKTLKAGKFRIYCTIHPGMRGRVVVGQ